MRCVLDRIVAAVLLALLWPLIAALAVAVRLGDLGALVEKRDPGQEILHRPFLANSLAVLGQPPAVETFELLAGLLGGVRLDAPLAGQAFLLSKLVGTLNGHGRCCSTLLAGKLHVATHFRRQPALFDAAGRRQTGETRLCPKTGI